MKKFIGKLKSAFLKASKPTKISFLLVVTFLIMMIINLFYYVTSYAAESDVKTYSLYYTYSVKDNNTGYLEKYDVRLSYTSDCAYRIVFLSNLSSTTGGYYETGNIAYIDSKGTITNLSSASDRAKINNFKFTVIKSEGQGNYNTVTTVDNSTVTGNYSFTFYTGRMTSTVTRNSYSGVSTNIPYFSFRDYQTGGWLNGYTSASFPAIFTDVYACTAPLAFGYYYYNPKTNQYNYTSTYSPTVVAPNLRQAGYHYAIPAESTIIPDYIVTMKYLIPKVSDVSAYNTEVWADIPIGKDSNGNIIYDKKFLKSYKTSTLLKDNSSSSSDGAGGWIPTDYGKYYEISFKYSDLLSFYTSIQDINRYGGAYIYLRNAKYISASQSITSDYAYFLFLPSKATINGNEHYEYMPSIHNGSYKNFDENKGNNNQIDTDPTTPNSGEQDYIGGDKDTPNNDMSDKDTPGSGTGSGTGSLPSYDTDWSVSDFTSWVKSGFGLFGDNGIFSFIVKLFSFLPAPVFNLIMWGATVGCIVAVIKLIL